MTNEESWLTPARKDKLLNGALIIMAICISALLTYLVQ